MRLAIDRLQQCLPLAVLKRCKSVLSYMEEWWVATVPTACGIETCSPRLNLYFFLCWLQQCLPLAVLKLLYKYVIVAIRSDKLQQCLPLAVLKLNSMISQSRVFESCNSAYRLRYWNSRNLAVVLLVIELQQCLPLAVLKQQFVRSLVHIMLVHVATVLTACGIETLLPRNKFHKLFGLL